MDVIFIIGYGRWSRSAWDNWFVSICKECFMLSPQHQTSKFRVVLHKWNAWNWLIVENLHICFFSRNLLVVLKVNDRGRWKFIEWVSISCLLFGSTQIISLSLYCKHLTKISSRMIRLVVRCFLRTCFSSFIKILH